MCQNSEVSSDVTSRIAEVAIYCYQIGILNKLGAQVEKSQPEPKTIRHIHEGQPYTVFVAALVQHVRVKTYLEVGVNEGNCMTGVQCDTAIGVDPKFNFKRNPALGKKRLFLYQVESDTFFAENDVNSITNGPIDFSFLDGLHLFEFLLRDFMNAERVSHGSAVILLDDCLPANIEMTERDFRPGERIDTEMAGWWTGDVWKVVSILRQYRPDLTITPVNTQPTGCVMVSGLNPKSEILKDNYEKIIDEYSTVDMTEALFRSFHEVNKTVASLDVFANPTRYGITQLSA